MEALNSIQSDDESKHPKLILFFLSSTPNDTVAQLWPPQLNIKPTLAKLQAMRAKRSRYYAKCREEILAKRREKYHLNKNRRKDDDGSDNKGAGDKGAGDNLDKGNDGSDECASDADESIGTLAECIAVVKYAKDDFMAHIKSPQKFTLGVFAEYTKSIPDAPGTHRG
ncbi:hypothetical protein F4604DRAFT_1931311 [Suillus subluteus]|nr:hypothetical protein F4604DRAFT_1931311 [Suillus subluteus]